MVLFPPITIASKSPQYDLVSKFIHAEYWKPEYDDLFARDIAVEFPYAPPGMVQHMIPFEFSFHRFWLNKTITDWKFDTEPVIIPTTDPNLLWAISWGSGKVHWAKRDGNYKNECVYRLVVRDGRIQELRAYENPISYFDAIGVILPGFNYMQDVVESAENARMGKGQKSRFSVEQNIQRAINNFANPINGHDGDPEPIYANDIVEVTPYAPLDMYEEWRGERFDIQCEWMFRRVNEWNTIDKVPFYQSTDPNVIIVESYGHGRMSWSGCDGHYFQRELQIICLDNEGKVGHFRVYFNPINKFNSMNQSIPSFPYFNY